MYQEKHFWKEYLEKGSKGKMPIYEFDCGCGNTSEKLVGIGTKSIRCEKCGKDMVKVISKNYFHLKGPGWAADSYGIKEKKKSNK